jgi:hypothetical protein
MTETTPSETSPVKPATNGSKDIWDKLSTLTTLISSVVIGGAGVAATYLYNNRELEIKHIEKQEEEGRLQNQAAAANQVQTVKQLEELFKLVPSDNMS